MKRILILLPLFTQLSAVKNETIEVRTIKGILPSIYKYPEEKKIVFFNIGKTIGYLGGTSGDKVEDFKLIEQCCPEAIREIQEIREIQDEVYCCAVTGRIKKAHEMLKKQLLQHGIDFSISTPYKDDVDPKNLPNLGHLGGIIYTGDAKYKAQVISHYLKQHPEISFALYVDNDSEDIASVVNVLRTHVKRYQTFLYTGYADMKKRAAFKALISQPAQQAQTNSNTDGMEKSKS